MHAPSPRPTETPEGRRITRYDDAGRHVGTGDAGTPSILPPQGTVGGDPGGAAPRKWTRHCALVALACSEALARPPQGALGTASEVLAQRSPAHQRAWLAPESPRCSRLLSPVPKPPGGDIEAAARTMTKHSPAAPRKSCSLCKRVCGEAEEGQTPKRTGARNPERRPPSDPHPPLLLTTPGQAQLITPALSLHRGGPDRPPGQVRGKASTGLLTCRPAPGAIAAPGPCRTCARTLRGVADPSPPSAALPPAPKAAFRGVDMK